MNLYQILGVSHDATTEEIRDAYRRMRSSSHPDKQGDASMFIRIQKAYDVLSDEKRRAEYDATGSMDAIPDSKAQSTLIELVIQATNNLDDAHDPLQIVRQGIIQGRANQQQIKQHEASIRRHEKLCKRIIRKNGGDNFLVGSLQHGIEVMRKRIAECLVNISLGQEMLVLLDEFEYDMPKQEPAYAMMYIGATQQRSFYRPA